MEDITTVITRRKLFRDKKCWITTNSIFQEYNGKWSHALYLHFDKANFPNLKYPELIPCDWSHLKGKRFEYSDSDLATLDWYGGITFYEEHLDVQRGEIFVKVGCDFQHYMDDHYEMSDHGLEILKSDGVNIVKEFLELIERRSKPELVEGK